MAKKKNAQLEVAELEEAYRQISDKEKTGSKRRLIPIVLISIAVCVLITGGLGVYLYLFSNVPPGLIMENISILDVDIGGLSKEDAATTLQSAAYDTYAEKDMVVSVSDHTVVIDSKTANIVLDIQAAVESAYALGRTGSIVQRKAEQLQAMTVGIQMAPASYLTMDKAAIRAALEPLDAYFNVEVVPNTWQVIGQIPDLTAPEEPEENQTLVITLGTPGYVLDIESLYSAILDAYLNCIFQVAYDYQTTEPTPIDLAAIHAEHTIAPVDSVMDKETFKVTDHAYGYSFDLERTAQLVSQAQYGEEVTVPFARVAPKETKESLESILFRDVLGTYTAYAASIPGSRDVNLRLSCRAINGIVLMPGEVFSYNPALGERTPEAGYKEADGYEGMETVQTYGGGICQASSCLYLSAMLADLEIVERVNHTFISAYMPYGMDATVSWGGPEFRFRNSTEYPLRIEAKASGGAVTVKLVGTDTKDYYVKMTYEVLSSDSYETVYQEMDADNEKGYKDGDQVVSGYKGYKIRTYRCKYDKETDKLISKEREATSIYRRRDRVICKIKTEDPTTETTLPEDTSVPDETTIPEETTRPEETTGPDETTGHGETTDPDETTAETTASIST